MLILCMMFVCVKLILLRIFIGCVVMKLFDMMLMCVCVIGEFGRFWLIVVLMLRCILLVVFFVDLSVCVLVMCSLCENLDLILCRFSCFLICGCELCISMIWMFIVCNSVMLDMSVFSSFCCIILLLNFMMNVLLWNLWI